MGHERPGLVGRDITTGALVRSSAHTPIWSMWTGPDEFAHWVLHTRQSTPYQAATSPDGRRRVVWTGGTDADCPNPWAWHVSQAKPSPYVMQEPSPQWIEEHRAERCTLDLGELEQALRAKAEAELANKLELEAKYDEFKALPLIVLAA
jgi:hypothetical protein